MDDEEIARASRNIKAIGDYLREQFKDYLYEVKEKPPINVVFHLTHMTNGERLTLGVVWPTLGDCDKTPAFLEKRMMDDDLAGRLRNRKEYFWTADVP
jgi:hypothetical protein